MKSFHSAILLLLLLPFLVACSSDKGTAGQGSATPTTSSAPAPTSPEPTATAIDPDRQILAPGAIFTLPASWTREPPAIQMRLAQAQIPGAGGPGQLTVFHFGPGGGGGTEANLQRWIGQLEGGSTPVRDTFTLGSWKVTWIDLTGTLKPSSMGVGPSESQPNSRLLGAVVEGAGGPWFFKATGPDQTLADQRDAFLQLLKSGRPNSAA